jgi:SLAP domain-containing protein
MDNNLDIILSLADGDSVSQLRKLVYEEELKEINSKFPISENKVDIKKTYFIKSDNTIEVGFFIRNSLETNVSFEDVVLVLQDKNDKNILSKKFNFKGYGSIPSFSARPFSAIFELNGEIDIIENEEYNIKFAGINNSKSFFSVSTEIENMPDNLTFEEEKAIRDFANSLDTLKEDEIAITVYAINYNDSKGIDCVLIVRNGNDKNININKLPITVVNENGEKIARNVFENPSGILVVSPKKSKLVKFTFKSKDIFIHEQDLSRCKVMYQ